MKRYTKRYDVPKIAGIDFKKVKSITQQHFKERCDVNYILAKFAKDGALDPNDLSKKMPHYGDYSQVNYLAALEVVTRAKADFDILPSSIRAMFSNDVSQMLDFIADPANAEEAVRLGILNENDYVTPVPIQVPEVKPEPDQADA